MKRPSTSSFRILVFFAVGLAACNAAAPPVPPPVSALPALDTTPQSKVIAERPRELPPPPGPAIDVHLPAANWTELPGGIALGILPVGELPLAEVRVIVRGGRAAESDRPGAAAVVAELVKRSAADVESLGARLQVEAGDDAITLRLGVPAAELGPALEKVGAALRSPKIEARDVEKIRKRLAGDAADLLREDGEEAAEWMLRRSLFSIASGIHPYARAGALPEELEKLAAADARAFHERTFTAVNTTVLIAGAIDRAAASKAAAKAFTGYREKAPRTPPAPVAAPTKRRIFVVNTPKAERSHVLIGFLGPSLNDAEHAAFAVVDRLLGAKGTGRLFMDVRETRSLAYTANTRSTELAEGPEVFAAYAETQTSKTRDTVAALLENLERLGKDAPQTAEVEVARQAARGALSAKLRTVGDIADEVSNLRVLGLPADYHDRYRRALDVITPELVRSTAAHFLPVGRETIVVAGDAQEITKMLASFGDVVVVDPAKGFSPAP